MISCPSCGQENPEGFRLCGMCGASLVPERQIDHGRSESERRQADLRAMARSQDIAAAVALRELGHKVVDDRGNERSELRHDDFVAELA